MSQQIGFAAEHDARAFLEKKGLQWVSSNYRCRWGEVDLIMRDKDYYIFVEVRSRVSNDYGGAMASITASKKRKIIKSSTHYLITNKLYDKCSVRFDVVSIQGRDAEIVWIKDAFGVNY